MKITAETPNIQRVRVARVRMVRVRVVWGQVGQDQGQGAEG